MMRRTSAFILAAALFLTVSAVPAGAKRIDIPRTRIFGTKAADGYSSKTVRLDICLSGNASISSVKVESLDSAPVSGLFRYLPLKRSFTALKGYPFAVLNCTNEGAGVGLGANGTHFLMEIVPGKYPLGLDITVCDMSHRVMRFHIPGSSFATKGVVSIKKAFTPDGDVLFYEGFDNCVEEMQEFIQPNSWDKVKNARTVSESSAVSPSYLKSRNFSDWRLLFRCQECPGCLGVGLNSKARGIAQTPPCGYKGICDGILSFDVSLESEFDGKLLVQVLDGGYPVSVSVDGTTLSLPKGEFGYRGVAGRVLLQKVYLPVPSSKKAKSWHHVEVKLERITGGTSMYIADDNVRNGSHGFYLDNIELRKTSGMKRGNLRVLYWNIQNGMWADQHNGYENFVEWVKRYDPDVCVWCECVTIYKDRTGHHIGNRAPDYKGYLPAHYRELAERYGHKFTAMGGARDNYPQAVTSKYPIRTVRTITDGVEAGKPVSHGAGLHEVCVGGKSIYLVTLHTWPHAYRYGCPKSERAASKAACEGDYYRQYEMQCILDLTRNNPEYADHADWLMMGDFNSRSRLDNDFYKYEPDSPLLLCQNVILDKSDYVDIIGKRYEGDFLSSTGGKSRIDYIYASPSMYGCVKNAMILVDEWANPVRSNAWHAFFEPSDHRPILVDFEF